jgi:hypothetical protein
MLARDIHQAGRGIPERAPPVFEHRHLAARVELEKLRLLVRLGLEIEQHFFIRQLEKFKQQAHLVGIPRCLAHVQLHHWLLRQ